MLQAPRMWIHALGLWSGAASKREANAHYLIHAESMLETGADLACRAICQSCKQLLWRRCDSDTAAGVLRTHASQRTLLRDPRVVARALLRHAQQRETAGHDGPHNRHAHGITSQCADVVV